MKGQGHIGIDRPVSAEHEERPTVRRLRRGASAPRPVRPHGLQASGRPDTGLAARRPAADPGGIDRGGIDRGGIDRGGVDRGGVDRGGVDRGGVDRGGGARAVGGPGAIGAVDVGAPGVGPLGVGGAGPRALGAMGLGRAAREGRGAVVERQGWVRPPSSAVGARRLVRARPVAPRHGDQVRRVMAGLALVLAAAAVVVGLGRIADLAAHARGADAPAVARVAEVTVTVAAPGTVWEIADGVAPGASGPQRAALVDRIVAANSLTSLRVWPGEVLRVPL